MALLQWECFAKEATTLRETLEDTLDWVAARCGLTVPARAPRPLRAAVRALGSGHPALRHGAEMALRASPNHAIPLLRAAASAHTPLPRAVRAAILLHRLHEREGADSLRRMAREHRLREAEGSELLCLAVREIVGAETYLRQASSALTLLEQRPESFRGIARFRQAMEILRFLRAPLPDDVLRRGLVVRAVGGENLSLVRAVLNETHGVSLEHVCMTRKETVETILRLDDRSHAYLLLARALKHPNPAVQLTAIYGLGSLEDPRAITPLLEIVRDPDHPVHEDARRVYLMLRDGTPDVLTLLRPSRPTPLPLEELLRPAIQRSDDSPETLLRPRP